MRVLIFMDGGGLTNPGETACSSCVMSSDGEILVEGARRCGHGTNNTAEYEALLLSIRVARLIDPTHVDFISDSKLVVMQTRVLTSSNFWDCRDEDLKALLDRVIAGLDKLPCSWTFDHVPRRMNRRADWLVNRLIRPDTQRGRVTNPRRFNEEERTRLGMGVDLPETDISREARAILKEA